MNLIWGNFYRFENKKRLQVVNLLWMGNTPELYELNMD